MHSMLCHVGTHIAALRGNSMATACYCHVGTRIAEFRVWAYDGRHIGLFPGNVGLFYGYTGLFYNHFMNKRNRALYNRKRDLFCKPLIVHSKRLHRVCNMATAYVSAKQPYLTVEELYVTANEPYTRTVACSCARRCIMCATLLLHIFPQKNPT